jgi:hypothetical protein
MSRVIEKTVYTYDELSDRAKEKAREWWREDGLSYDWWDSTYEMLDDAAKLLGIEIDRKRGNMPAIWFQGFYTQGSGSAFDGRYYYRKGAAKEVRKEFPKWEELHRIADALQAVQRKYFYKLSAGIRSERDTWVSVNVEHDDRPYDCPDDAEEAVKEAMRDFNHLIFGTLEDEYEYLMSDEAVEENIKANEYEFDEEGCIA